MLNSDKILALQSTSFQCLLRHISLELLTQLDKRLVEVINFVDVMIVDKERFRAITCIDLEGPEKGRGIAYMTPKQVTDAIQRGLFDSETAYYIPDDTLQKISKQTFKKLPKTPINKILRQRRAELR